MAQTLVYWPIRSKSMEFWSFSFPPMLQIHRNFHKIMHDSKFGHDGLFLIVLKTHPIPFFRSFRHIVVQNRSSKSWRPASAKFEEFGSWNFLLHFSPHGGSNHFFWNFAMMVRFSMDLLWRPQNSIGRGQPVVVVRSIKVVTHCDTFKLEICSKTVHRISRVSALAS